MNNEIKKVLTKIENNGFEAYVVGGFVRDYLLGIKSFDVDICTNALPKDIISIFGIKKDTTNFGSISFMIGKYSFDITTYREEYSYENRKPKEVKYTNNLISDLARRDFTINSLCMNKSGHIIDNLDGRNDLNNKVIKVIGNIEEKFTEDPLRILRSIRFAITLDFELDKDIVIFINKHKELISSLSFTRKKQELDKIFSSKNVKNGLNLLKELNLLDVLNIKYDNIEVVPDLLGIWSQIDFDSRYNFTRYSMSTIEKIRNILNKGFIDNYDLFTYGLYICTVAGQILGIEVKTITKLNSKLSIRTPNELKITQKDIINLLEIEPSPYIRIIYDDVLKKVLSSELKNSGKVIKKYILKTWK